MPTSGPQTLTNDEHYALTAWVLWVNEIIVEDEIMNRDTLPEVVMPNRDGFTCLDPRLAVDKQE